MFRIHNQLVLYFFMFSHSHNFHFRIELLNQSLRTLRVAEQPGLIWRRQGAVCPPVVPIARINRKLLSKLLQLVEKLI